MGTNKLQEKLNHFFGLSEKKQSKKHEKLVKIINKLEEKKSSLEKKMIVQSRIDETAVNYHDMRDELNVISKLIKKAKKKNIAD
ncbi:MAG: hypothetical protein GY705_30480 [Bacteroidetes bacterium]|nr:hypothetical protein [Bacteroidota bacterium]